MSKTNTLQEGESLIRQHQESVDLTGLEGLFQWASDVVAEGDDDRLKSVREKRIRRQVLEVIQTHREDKVIALLAKLQEVTEENAACKQIMVSQSYALEKLPSIDSLSKEVKRVELERDSAVTERRYLMEGLSKLKVERDYLEDILTASEEENIRLAKLLQETRSELEEIKNRRWWHLFFPTTKK
jgi:septal ring factor EnvC (AmiA/AmiB activator)